MRYPSLIGGIGVTLWLAMSAFSQPAASLTLAAELREQVKSGRFGVVTSIRGLPLGIRDALQELFGNHALDIADPGDAFQQGEAGANSLLRARRLEVAGWSMDRCLVYYQRGGRAQTWYVALFHWTPAATRFEWGGIAPPRLSTLDQVRGAMLSGAIKSGARPW